MSDIKKKLKAQIAILPFNRKLLWSYASIASLILLLFSATIYWGITNVMRQQILKSYYETLVQTRISINDYMDDVNTLLFNISTNKIVLSNFASGKQKTVHQTLMETEQIREYLTTDVFAQKTNGVLLFAFSHANYPDFTIYSHNREAGHTTRFGIYNDRGYEDADWMVRTKAEQGGVLWIEPQFDPVRKQTEISANKLILDMNNLQKGIGIARVFVPESRFQEVFQNISLGMNGHVSMIAGNSLIHSGGGVESEYLLLEGKALTDGIVQRTIGGEGYYVISCSLDKTSWKLVGLIKKEKLMSRYEFINQTIVVTLLLFLFMAVLFLGKVSAGISKPILRVTEAMRHFDSDPGFRFGQTNSLGDMGILFRSFNRMMDRMDQLFWSVKEKAQQQRKAELQALQAQINPHFLYNTLECIKSMSYTGDGEQIAEMTTALSEFFRASLNGGREMLPLRQEINMTLSYCAIVKYRNKTPFNIFVEVPEEMMEFPVIKLMLQPLVENSICHGFSQMEHEGHIKICAYADNEKLILTVSDNGLGADVEYMNGLLSGEYTNRKESLRSGYGITSVQERLKLVYGNCSSLVFEKKQAWLNAIIEIPLQREEGIGKDGTA